MKLHDELNGPIARVDRRGMWWGIVTLLGVACLAPAQALHETDMVIRMGGSGAIETGLPDQQGGIAWGERVAFARLDTGQFSNLSDNPGFDSTSGSFPAGTGIGFDLLDALRVWNGSDFAGVEPEYAMSVTKGNDVVTTPASAATVPGFQFGSADSGGRFHHHVRYFLDPLDPFTDEDGIWMLTLGLWSTNPTITPSEPVYLVFGSGPTATADRDAAIAWVQDNLVGSGACTPADLAEPFGTLDLADITAFVGAFTGGDALADLAAPFGLLDLADITAFVGSFVAGCP
jgi:hypothetical protein